MIGLSQTVLTNNMDKTLEKLIKEISDSNIDFKIEHPSDLSHGDYSTNVALVLAKEKNQNPKQLAEDFANKIRQKIEIEQKKLNHSEIDSIEKVEVAGPGFINFYLKKTFFAKEIQRILHLENNYGRNKRLSGKTILIEFTDPNPFKQFHIGHLMSNSIGESLARIFQWNGAKVVRLSYGGDVGPHVAKTIWGMKQMQDKFPKDEDSLSDKTKFIGLAYALGHKKYEEDEVAHAEIDEINKKVYQLYDDTQDNNDPEIKLFYKKGKDWSLQHFDEIYADLGTNFDRQIFESLVFALGEKIIRKNTPEIFELSDGAIIYRGEKEGLHNRVFINSLGLPTYEAKDIGLAHFKETEIAKKLGKFDVSIIITANEQSEYFKVILSALGKINSDIAKKTKHLSHGMMKFTSGKMSSRSGNVITGESLIAEMEKLVAIKIADRNFDEAESSKTKKIIAVGAIKYSILKNAIGHDILFDSDNAISFEGNSGPYLQYTYIRAKSVVDKAAEQGIRVVDILQSANWQPINLEKKLYRFEEIVAKSYEEFAPQQVAVFANEIASDFNTFYGTTQLLDGGADQEYKVALAKAVMYVLQNALTILGIRVPQRM